jgi:hypothetical protein
VTANLIPNHDRTRRITMTETHGSGDRHEKTPAPVKLREQLLRDALGDCVPLAHVDHIAAQNAAADSLSARQDLVISAVRSLIEDGLMVMGAIVGGSDERVEPWPMTLDDAMARLREKYVLHYDDQNWVFGVWFALTDSGEQAARALETKGSEA